MVPEVALQRVFELLDGHVLGTLADLVLQLLLVLDELAELVLLLLAKREYL